MGLKGDFSRSDVTNRGPAPMVARSLSALLQRVENFKPGCLGGFRRIAQMRGTCVVKMRSPVCPVVASSRLRICGASRVATHQGCLGAVVCRRLRGATKRAG